MSAVLPANAEEENKQSAYPYAVFAADEQGGITLNLDYLTVNGNGVTNGVYSTTAMYPNINGTISENEFVVDEIVSDDENTTDAQDADKPFDVSRDMIYIHNKLMDSWFNNAQNYADDYTLSEMNINLNSPVYVTGRLNYEGNVALNSAIGAVSDVNLSGGNLNGNNAVIYSKFGDIKITDSQASMNGLIYAPFGTVTIDCDNFNLNGLIIAQNVVVNSTGANINYNNSWAEFVGTETEELSWTFADWKYLADTDEDGLPNLVEKEIGTKPYEADTDGDLLPDGYEVLSLGTDPLKVDTDDNDISDYDEDFDTDGLSNGKEYEIGTRPFSDDSDGDSLKDGDEVNTYFTDPLEVDTDKDGLNDDDEIYFGTDPNDPDSDDNGTKDGDEKRSQTFIHKVENKDCAITEVIVSMEATGNLQKTTEVESIMNKDIICTDVVGLVGEPFSIETTSKYKKATLSFKIDQSKLEDTELDNLLFLWYDEDNYKFVELNTIYDEANSLVSIETTHFSRYMVVDKDQWFEAWAVEFDYNPAKEGTHGEPNIYHNTVLAIDCSGSMDGIDKIEYNTVNSQYDYLNRKTCQRIKAANQFIQNMNDIDKTAVVLFTHEASTEQSMTDNKDDLKLSLQSVTSNGGTNFYEALTEAYKAFEENTIGAANTNNRIILLSDGDDGNYSQTMSLLNSIYGEGSTDKRKSIKIYTIGLGYYYDSNLKRIAEISNGEFFKAYTATELVDIYTKIGIGGDFDDTDTDGDKLYDAVESAGIRIQNGVILKNNPETDIYFSDPTEPDTDYDGVDDGKEIDPTIRWRIGDSGKREYYFFMYSNPGDKDSDGDGFIDNTDIDPMNYDEVNGLLYQSLRKIGIGYVDGEIAHDLVTNDQSSNDMIGISDLFQYQLDSSEEYLYEDFKGLMDMFAISGEGREIVSDLIDKFIYGTEESIDIKTNNGIISLPCYNSPKLIKKVISDEQVQKYEETVVEEFTKQLKKYKGNIIEAKRAMQDIIEDSKAYDIAFSRDDLSYLLGGMTLSINDLWGSSVNIHSINVDGNSYNGVLHFRLYDHFGLDIHDVEKIYVNLAGFRAWYVLQHYDGFNGKYKPFINVIDDYVYFEGVL